MNNLNIDHLRIEIAYLQEEILSSDPPKRAKFKIPVIMTEDRVTSLKTSNKNILNRSNGNISGSPINLDNTIELEVPLEYTFFYGAEKIPKDTRFLVTFVGGNVNDIKIIGRYDSAVSNELQSFITISQQLESSTSDINNIKNTVESVNNSIGDVNEKLNIIKQYAQELDSLKRQVQEMQSKIDQIKNNTPSGGEE